MLLNDSLGVLRRYALIPRPLRIDDRDRAADADAQTLALGSIERPIRTGDVQFLHPLFDVVPRFFPFRRFDAIGAQANEKMPGELSDSKLRGNDRRGIFFWISHVSHSKSPRVILRGQARPG